MAKRSLGASAILAVALVSPCPAGAETFDPIGSLLGTIRGDVETTGAIEPARPAPVRAELQPPAAPGTIAPAPERPAAPLRSATPRAAEPDAYPVDLLISLANDAVYTKDPYPKGRRSDPRMIKLQVLLDRNNASPGVIDGMFGDNVVKAVKAFEEMKGFEVDGKLDPELWAALEATSDEPVLVSYTITPEDVAGPFVPTMPHDYAEQAQLPGLAYRDAAEMLAERFHMDEAFLRRLNPDVSFAAAGVDVVVANPGKPLKLRLAHIVADKVLKQLRGYDASGKLVVAYPATIGSSDTPSPTGRHVVKAIALNPDYWYRPKVNFVQGTNTRALRLSPGPNGPVGATWVGLDKPTYGLHGTPEPSKIDKTNSHGCVRLTNWDARELAGLVAPGVPVDFQGPAGMETPVAEIDPVAPVEAVEPKRAAAPRAPSAPRMLAPAEGRLDSAAEPLPAAEPPAPLPAAPAREAATEPEPPAVTPLEPLPPPRVIPYRGRQSAMR